MDKIVFLMGRKDGLVREQFFEHYLNVHSLLGLRMCVLMEGYTVNLTDGADPGPEAPDSITEVWTPDANGFMDPGRAFRNEEEMMEVVNDDQSFIGTTHAYIVEEELAFGSWPSGEVRTRTPGVKRVSMHIASSVPPVADGIERVTIDRVKAAITPDAPAIDAFVSEWAQSAEVLAPLAVPSYLVSEYRQRLPARPGA
jgi:hypothetical protein